MTDDRSTILAVQDRLKATKARAAANGVTKKADLENLSVEVPYKVLARLLMLAGRQNGMIWNGEEWV